MSEKKRKILLVSPYNAQHVGGIGTWSKSILDYFQNSDNYSIIFQNTRNPIKNNTLYYGVFRLIIGCEDTIVILIKLFINLLFHRPAIVHYTSSASYALAKDKIAVFITKKIFRKKFIMHWHFGRIPDICTVKGKEYKKLLNVVRSVDQNIVLDNRSLDFLKTEGCNNVCCIPNPMTSAISEAVKDLNQQNVSLQRNVGEVLFVGYLVEGKGVFELVSACTEISLVKKLIMVGPEVAPGIKVQLQEIAQKRDNAEWLEFKGELQREEVYQYYKNCSMFCLPSHTEGFPYVILEAMAFGCPIVSTDVGAIAEMLKDESGVVVRPKDVRVLAESVKRVLSDNELRYKIGVNAFNRVMSVYSNEAIFNQYDVIWC